MYETLIETCTFRLKWAIKRLRTTCQSRYLDFQQGSYKKKSVKYSGQNRARFRLPKIHEKFRGRFWYEKEPGSRPATSSRHFRVFWDTLLVNRKTICRHDISIAPVISYFTGCPHSILLALLQFFANNVLRRNRNIIKKTSPSHYFRGRKGLWYSPQKTNNRYPVKKLANILIKRKHLRRRENSVLHIKNTKSREN